MAQQIVVEQFTTALYDLLDETFEHVHGIYLDGGTSLFETLATISAEEASRPVSARCASLAAQVNHVRFYLEMLEGYIRGNEIGKVDWDASWQLQSVTSEEWEAVKQRLRDRYQSVLSTLKGFETWNGEPEIEGALAIAAHTAYHLGEIRQALCFIKL